MKIKRDESHCYAAVITEDGQWQKGEEYFLEDYTETLFTMSKVNLGMLKEIENATSSTYDSHGNCLSSHLYDPEDEELTDCWEEKQYRYNDLHQQVECITYEDGKWKKLLLSNTMYTVIT